MRTVLTILLSLLLTACVTGDNIKDIHEGMTKSEVISDARQARWQMKLGDQVALKYAKRLMSGWSWDRTDYWVILVDDKVSEWGNGEVRQEQPTQTLILVPLH